MSTNKPELTPQHVNVKLPNHTIERSSGVRSLDWWIRLVLPPLLFLLAGTALFAGLGIAQNLGWLSDSSGGTASGGGQAGVRYICPMMCTPPTSEPGRCPVCAMELVPATSASGDSDPNMVEIEPAARRLAHIKTIKVVARPFHRVIRAVGELNYDESNLKTIAAYVDGRLEKLYANFTGMKVAKGTCMGLIYSPALYSGQVELLTAQKVRANGDNLGNNLYVSARQKLLDLGMTQKQIHALQQTGIASSRIHLYAPISGTVIEKRAAEGEYIKEGKPILKLADLSHVWLMLKMFPQDAAAVKIGQQVTAKMRSLPGQTFFGQITFIDPNVDPKTQTVNVRVVMPNNSGILRIGDYATAKISLPTYENGLVIPRDAVLAAGEHSVVYVEIKPGRFEIRRVVLGPTSNGQIVIRKGLEDGEIVATSGNFLIDSQMQLAGNPSLIDPTKATSSPNKYAEAFAKLDSKDRKLAEKQHICPVTKLRLGSMGKPIRVEVKGKPVFICCEGCRNPLVANPEKHFAILEEQTKGATEQESDVQPNLPPVGVPQLIVPEEGARSNETEDKEAAAEIAKELAKLPPADQALAKKQKICAVAGEPLGSMGRPIRVNVNGRIVFICCEGCRKRLLREPAIYLRRLSKGAEK